MTAMELKEIDVVTLAKANPFVQLVQKQKIVEVPELTLESGITISKFPVAYKTWGKLNDAGDNVLVICHALTGSADVADWWGPLLGRGLAFDTSRFLVVCLNALGSPYGSFSPLTVNSETGARYGPEFPLCTVRDDVRAHKLVLESLGVRQIACVVGGSMGGMVVLEWAALFKDYVQNVVALATSARNSAWCISWSEAQRQSIYSDPKYLDGYYPLEDPPVVGLSAARMSALLTYRSRDSFETKFARKVPSTQQQRMSKREPLKPSPIKEHNRAIHNDGLTSNSSTRHVGNCSISSSDSVEEIHSSSSATSLASVSSANGNQPLKPPQTYFSAQSYLRYQGNKFVKRFDANCYISITRKLDTHDLGRDRPEYSNNACNVLNDMSQPALVIGINSDGLFTYSEQEFLATHMPNARLERIDSPDGHDAFLLEFKLINDLIIGFFKENLREIMTGLSTGWEGHDEAPVKDSVFGEAEEITNW
ncbi:AFR682Cp [Eremothecium gossypii ATCC 10895]|uniref:AFR682Cp n=1 Tax=Eremothecium gossypii (strain ATCC 10895 / CBS 109.51 / FGSC 9923 / NRRL Y-1056) TaxID=284811 RepID=Q751Z3_EREGS|nr:AFR682Cp [Eremothecium gossypii ATCC 10895]AAS54054.1 AFR682Cp [Eremothecium gossypii ATCC 10895]AEY98369.1 FAFR682Cp [Eremothecium gossypii FDAG1]